MRDRDEFYEIKGLISKQDIDAKLKDIISERRSKSSLVFNALENNGIKVYEVSVHSASARIQPKHITLDVSSNGESTSRKGFKRYDIEDTPTKTDVSKKS